MKRNAKPTPAPMAFTFRQWYELVYPCSRARATEYVRTGELETFVDHGRRMVLPEKSREFVARKAAQGGAVPPEVSARRSAAGRKGRAMQIAAAEEIA